MGVSKVVVVFLNQQYVSLAPDQVKEDLFKTRLGDMVPQSWNKCFSDLNPSVDRPSALFVLTA